MSLYRDLLSLSEVVEVVARCISIDDADLDVDVLPNGKRDDVAAFMATVETTSRRALYQMSRAAELLGLVIANTPAGQRLRWFDVTLGAGETYWQSVAARDEGLAFLGDMAKWERGAQEARRRHDRLADSRWSTNEPDSGRFLDMPTQPRIRQIGFNSDELVGFLLAEEIPNALVVGLPGASSEMIDASTTQQPAGDVVPDRSARVSAVSTEAKTFTARKATSRGPMPIPENRDHVSTDELASILAVEAQSIRKRYSETGSFHGIRPTKLPSRRLLWPVEAVKDLIQGRAPVSE